MRIGIEAVPCIVLTVSSGRNVIQRWFPFQHRSVDFGRAPDCDVVLFGNLISRRHATLTLHPTLRLRDYSRNGTSVGDRLVHGREVALGAGNSIIIGNYRVDIELAFDTRETRAEPQLQSGYCLAGELGP